MKNSRIDLAFKNLNGKKAFIPFITCGYPDKEGFLKLFSTLAENGADIIEIGLPFSDPIADGPVIQQTSKKALENGMDTDNLFNCIKKLRKSYDIPIAIMTYFNPVYRYGIDSFFKKCNSIGVDGLIIPDLPLEEFNFFGNYFKKHGIDNIMLASLASNKDRLKKITKIGRGFLYCVSIKGITGTKSKLGKDVKKFLMNLKKITKMPLALGFGLSEKKQIREIKNYCDGIIIGSKILSLVMESNNLNIGLDKVEDFVNEINKVLK